MNKICILGDTHWGVRNDLSLFYYHFETFYNKMFDDLESRGIYEIFQLGDLFDRRKYINFKTLSESRRIFFDQLHKRNFKLHVLIGNHDIHLRNTVDINSPRLMLNEYQNVTVYDKPTTIKYHNVDIDIFPWLCQSNIDESLNLIKNSSSKYCFGHFEIQGFEMYAGIETHDGLKKDIFNNYDLVLSGHYHTKSKKGNILYVGVPYEMNWNDCNDPKGYHIFDLETGDIEFIQNHDNIFIKIIYDDTKKLVDLKTLDLENRFIKLIVVEKTDVYKFDNFIQFLYNKGCYDIKIIEDIIDTTDTTLDNEINLEDTMDVLSNYIDSIDFSADKVKVKDLIKHLYIEAINAVGD